MGSNPIRCTRRKKESSSAGTQLSGRYALDPVAVGFHSTRPVSHPGLVLSKSSNATNYQRIMAKRQMALFYNPDALIRELVEIDDRIGEIFEKRIRARSQTSRDRQSARMQALHNQKRDIINEARSHIRNLSQTPPPSPIKIGHMKENPTEALNQQPSFFDTIPNS